MIRRGDLVDRPWIREIAAAVYRDLGDYGRIIPSWLDHPGILCYVDHDEQTGDRRGFALLGFYERGADGSYIADLLAIAVAPQYQGRGIGRSMLNYAIHMAKMAGRGATVSEMRLTVAADNDVGQHLYRTNGFRILDEDHGSYDGGQRAIRMALAL